MTRSLITAIAAACAFGIFAQPASAAESAFARREVVSYADLDLGRARGAEILLRRLERAAQRVCGNARHRRVSLVERAYFDRCVDEKLETAVGAINAPLVTQRFAARRSSISSS